MNSSRFEILAVVLVTLAIEATALNVTYTVMTVVLRNGYFLPFYANQPANGTFNYLVKTSLDEKLVMFRWRSCECCLIILMDILLES